MRSLILFLALSTTASAGPVPAWVETVTASTADGVTFIDTSPAFGSFSVVNMHDPRQPDGTQYLAMVGFLGCTQSPELFVTLAHWMSEAPYDVPLFVWSLPVPTGLPTLTDLPDRGLAWEIDITSGDYSASPLAVSLPGTGDLCFLLGTDDTTYFGAGQIQFTAAAPVPEPSSIVLALLAYGMIWAL